jgi:hypothetical protein
MRSLLPAVTVSTLLAGQTPASATHSAPRSATSSTVPAQAAPTRARTSATALGGMELTRTSHPVAPGTRLTSFQQLEPDTWLRADALSVKLGGGAEGTRADYLASEGVSTRRTVSEMVAEHDPGKGRRTVAAINGDFFDINETGAPLGPGVHHSRPTHSPEPGSHQAIGLGPGAAGRILDLYFKGTVALPTGRRPLAAYNAANVPRDGIAAYNSQWGKADRALTTDGDADAAEVTVRRGHVTSTAAPPGAGAVPEDTTVLVGREDGAKELKELKPGDAVSMAYHARTDDEGGVPRTAVGGRGLLVVDGRPQNWEGKPNNDTAPRTAVGFSKDGSTMHVLTVDGRSAASGGLTLTELALMMKDLGAYNALNLDGGGSSTLLAREPGAVAPQLENAPSDGTEREVPDGLALTAPRGSGRLRGFRVETAADPATSPTADTVPGGHPERVFPGLTRKLTATGYDETYGPAKGSPRWHTANPAVGRTDATGVFHARRAGTTRVTAARGVAGGSAKLNVIGALARVEPTKERVGLASGEGEGTFGILGFDVQGDSAPVDPGDVRLAYDRSRFAITPDQGHGGFTVRARPGHESASGILTATVQGHRTRLALTVGLQDQPLADFEDAKDWKFSAARAQGSSTADPEGHKSGGLRLNYDFSKSTATRAAYASPPKEIPVSGQPQSFRMWINSDGKGAWPSLHLIDAAGNDQVLRAGHLDEKGWQQVTFDVPEGVAYPVRVKRFYLAETRPGEQYAGGVVLDGLTAQTPPDVALPAARRPRDPLISTAKEVRGRDWRFAVMSDAQFVAREPSSPIVAQTRRTLRDIRAAKPDFLLINGDLVDEGTPADLRFAHQLLKRELGDAVKWYYVPGNHEVMGGGIEDFRREFGPAQRTFDHRGTRFITLDTSSLTLRGGGYAQIQELRRQLDAAARDRAVSSVAVIEHVPPRDPTVQAASRLTDRMEANLLEKWLSGFRARTGKGAALIGSHVGVFDASRVDGVPYLVNGNSGKTPAAPPGSGGFTGWSLIGVEEKPKLWHGWGHGRGPGRTWEGEDWLTVQTRPHLDGLTLEAPSRLRVGEAAKAQATVLQGTGDARREVPASWPVSTDWSGSGGLCLTPRKGQSQASEQALRETSGKFEQRCTAAYNPASGALTALRPGTVTLTVEVSGEHTQRKVSITR